MSKVVIVPFEKVKSTRTSKSVGVGVKRIRDGASGKLRTVRTLEGQSASFGDDLAYVFAKNVAKARRENKRVTGAADRVPSKT